MARNCHARPKMAEHLNRLLIAQHTGIGTREVYCELYKLNNLLPHAHPCLRCSRKGVHQSGACMLGGNVDAAPPDHTAAFGFAPLATSFIYTATFASIIAVGILPCIASSIIFFFAAAALCVSS